MLALMHEVPANVLGIRATGKVTKQDYDEVFMPALDRFSAQQEAINLILLVETDIGQYTPGALTEDMLSGFKHLTEWHKVAIVSDQEGVRQFTNIISKPVPGEYKGFETALLDEAMLWVSV